MKKISSLFLAFGVAFCLAATALPTFAQATVTNDVWLMDTAGNPIYAQGGNISKFGSTYYWVGVQYKGSSEYYSSGTANSDTEFQSINLYTSTDLIHWTGHSPLVTTSTSGFSTTSWVGRIGAMLYNSSTGKYVLWVEYDGSDGDGMACLTSSSPTSGWTLNNVQTSITNVYYNIPGDSTTFVDVDHSSTPYLVFSDPHGREHAYVSTFNSSYTSINAATLISEWAQGQEGDNMFERNGYYYIVMSELAGWSYSSDYVVWGTGIQTPSSYTKDATYAGTTADYTHHSQCSFVYELKGSADTSYISVGDRWADFDSSYEKAGYGKSYNTWGAITFSGETPTYNSVSSLTINVSTGALTW